MPARPWNTQQIKQFELETGQQLLQQEQLLVSVNQDFGNLAEGHAIAVSKPSNLNALQQLFHYATREQLLLTIRGNGLSQSGQSLSLAGGVTVDISELNTNVEWQAGKLIAGCSASWKAIISKSIERDRLPRVLPYNTDLTLGGVLSVGGLGATSFKEGVIANHIEALKVMTPTGEVYECSKQVNQDLFDACLSGVGLFGVIYEAVINTRPCKTMVRTQSLVYEDYSSWMADQFILREYCDYLEAFIVPHQDSNLCMISLSVEYSNTPPDLDFLKKLKFIRLGDGDDKAILAYCNRHDMRLQLMKSSGDWVKMHPWYECYVDSQLLLKKLDEIMPLLPSSLGQILHVFPVAAQKPRFFMLPEADAVVTFNILAPGLASSELDEALNALSAVDKILQGMGGKRYISGWFDRLVGNDYWLKHYGAMLVDRRKAKEKYDPAKILCSQLFPEM